MMCVTTPAATVSVKVKIFMVIPPLSGYQFGAATMIIIRYVTYICKNMEPSSDDFVWGFFAGTESVLYGKFWILM